MSVDLEPLMSEEDTVLSLRGSFLCMDIRAELFAPSRATSRATLETLVSASAKFLEIEKIPGSMVLLFLQPIISEVWSHLVEISARLAVAMYEFVNTKRH